MLLVYSFNGNRVVLPGWQVFKGAFKAIGKNHISYSEYLTNGGYNLCKALESEFVESYGQLKKL